MHEVLVTHIVKLAQKKSVVSSNYCLDITIAIDWDFKHHNRTASKGVLEFHPMDTTKEKG